jgi:hypothetical protein
MAAPLAFSLATLDTEGTLDAESMVDVEGAFDAGCAVSMAGTVLVEWGVYVFICVTPD